MDLLTAERARAMSRALPLPIADAMTALAAAESLHERRDRVVECFRATLRYLAATALAARVQFGPGPAGESTQLTALMRGLRQRGLTDGQWVGMLRHLLGAWAKRSDAYAMPALATLFTGKSKKHVAKAIDGLLEMRKAETVAHGATGTTTAIQAVLDRREPQLLDLLQRLEPVWSEAHLVVPLARADDEHPQRAWSLMGDTPNRGRWPNIALELDVTLEPGVPVLLDADGTPIVSLDPVAQFRRPSPDAVEELFVLDGAKRNAAVFVAFPSMAEIREKEVWGTLGQKLFDSEDAEEPPPATGGIARPYRGLSAFGAKHAALFFGRERLVEAVANRVRSQAMVTVTGPSGSGKSSLLLAGVVPALDELQAVVMRPGAHPRRMMARRLAEALGVEVEEAYVAEVILERPETLGSFLETRVRLGGRGLLLVIDQAEEVFTLCDSDQARLGFAEALASAGMDPNGSTRIVLSLREDYFARLSTLSPLRSLYSRHVEVVATPDPEDLFRILKMPADAFGFSFEDEQLLEEMLRSVEDEPAALAMLQFCADQMWERRDRKWKRLTRDAYRAVGGVAGALATHADSVLEGMTRSQQKLARGALLRCVTEDGTRAVAATHEIVEAIGDGAREVIETLVEARLLTKQTDDAATQTVELVHEALILHWEQLKEWLADDDYLLRIQARIGQAASRWHADGEPVDRLLGDGKPLIEAEELLTQHRDWLRPAEIEFIERSRARSLRGRRLRRLAITALAVLTVLAGAFGAVAWWARGRAEQMQSLAESNEAEATQRTIQLVEGQGRRELLEGNPTRAAIFLVDALQRGGDGRALHTMLTDAMRPVDGHRAAWPAQTDEFGSVGWLQFSPDGSHLVSADRRGRLWLWRTTDQALVASHTLAGESESVRHLTFLPDGRFAVGSRRGQVLLFDAAGQRVWTGASKPIVGMAVLDAGLLTASVDGTLRVWDVESGQEVVIRQHDGALRSIAVAPDGERVGLGAEDGTFHIYDWKSWEVVHTVTSVGPVDRAVHTGTMWLSLSSRRRTFLDPKESPLGYASEVPAVSAVSVVDAGTFAFRARLESQARVEAWSVAPDAKHLALVQFPNDIELWSTSARKVRHTWSGHERHARPGSATSPATRRIAHDGTGRYIASHGSDEAVRIWDGETGGLMSALPHRGQVTAMAWRAEGDVLATAEHRRDGSTLHLWEVNTKRLAGFDGKTIAIGDLLIAMDDEQQATGYHYADRILSRASVPLPEHGPWHVAVDAGGEHTIWMGHRRLQVLRADGTEVVRLDPFPEGHPAFQVGTYHAVKQQVLVGSVLSHVELWSVGGERVHVLEGDEPMHEARHLAFSKSGDRAVAAVRGKAIVWGLADGRKLLVTKEPEDGFSLSPEAHLIGDGTRLLDMTGARKARIWNIADRRVVLELDASQVVLSPDHRLILASQDGSPVASLYDAVSGRLLRHLEGHEDQVTALAFSPDGMRTFTGSKDGTIRTWDTTTGVCLSNVAAHGGGVRSLQALASRLVSTGANGSALWDISLETRSAAELSARLEAVAPWRWADGRLVPKHGSPPAEGVGDVSPTSAE